MKARIVLLFVGACALWALLAMRASYLQIFPNSRLQALQARQFETVVTLQNRRGAIVDRNGRDLALSRKAFSVFADPKLIQNKKQTAKKVASVLGLSHEVVLGKIKDPRRRFVWLQRLIDDNHAQEIKEMSLPGIQIVEEFKRVYPNETLLSQVLGFVGTEGQGLEGLELSYNQHLQGNQKKISMKRDARGRPLIVDGLMFAENPEGAEIKLTIDSELQYFLENELSQAMSHFKAESATGVILDAKTSEVLAMSSSPFYDLNHPSRYGADQRRNRGVTDMFEPGSTMKTFVIAGALHQKIIQPNTRYKTEGGKFKVGDRIIREAETNEKWESLTVSEILSYSSNIGTSKIAFDLGSENLQKILFDYGFGQKTGVELPGDVKGLVQALPWQKHLLANISFGQGVAVTALQLANAYAAIANGGVLHKPYIIQSILDTESGLLKEFQAQEVRRVLTPEESASMRIMLTGVTAPGRTGQNANVEGYMVAGKTGTAQKADNNGRGYLPGAYVSSFAGFVPATDPKFVIFVMVDHPTENSYYGSQVAAPIFSRLASYAVRRAGIAPVILKEKTKDKKIHLSLAAQKSAIGKKSLVEQKLVEQKTEKKNELKIVGAETAEQTSAPALELLPDLRHLTAREVLQKMSKQNLQIQFKGNGLVSETIPSYGADLTTYKKIIVILKPVEDSTTEAVVSSPSK